MKNNYFIILTFLFCSDAFCMQNKRIDTSRNSIYALRQSEESGSFLSLQKAIRKIVLLDQCFDNIPAKDVTDRIAEHFLQDEYGEDFKFLVIEYMNRFGDESLKYLALDIMWKKYHSEGGKMAINFLDLLIRDYNLNPNSIVHTPYYNSSLLHAAVFFKDQDLINLFRLKHGANRDIRDSQDMTPYESFMALHSDVNKEPDASIAALLKPDTKKRKLSL